ncbi:pentatricopeptide repeat-containing protein At1g77360, mitochondrial isoform X2 [Henckelia pumila]
MGDLRNLGSSLDNANFSDLSPSLVLQVLNKLNNSGTMALSFFRWAERQRSFQHTPECYNALIESLGGIKQFTMVWILVDEMKNNGLLAKETFALVSRRLARARRVNEAIEAFERMEKRYGLKPDLQDYNRLLDTLSKSKHVEKAQELFDTWKDWKFVPDIKSYAVLLEGWGDRCNFLRLNEVYLEMQGEGLEPDVVTYGILINAHCKAKRHDKAVGLFHEMSGKNIKATPHIYCTLINGLGAEKRLGEAIEFFNLYKSDCVMEAPTYNAMIGAYCWSMRIHDAYAIVDEMKQCGIGPHPRTYDIILHHLVKAGRTSEACSVFERMSDEWGVEPNLSTHEIMVRMFCNGGQMDMALKVWDQMRFRGMIPGMHMFLALINGLCDQKRVGEACEYLQEMLDMGIRPPELVLKRLKQGLLDEGKPDIVIILDGKIRKLRDSPLFG